MVTRMRRLPTKTILVLVGILGLCQAGCSEKYKGTMSLGDFLRVIARKKPTPPTTLIVSGEAITVDDIEDLPLPYQGQTIVLGNYLKPAALASGSMEQFAQAARAPVQITVQRRIWNILLYQKAKTEAGDPEKIDEALDKAMNRVWREYVVEHGGIDAVAIATLKEEENLTKEQFLENQKREMLSQIHLESKFRRDQPISHVELLEYYERLRDEHYQVKPKIIMRLIDIQLARLPLDDPTMDRQEEALKRARQLSQQIKEGADFGELAQQHSHGHMARHGGLWQERDPASLAPPYDALAGAAADMAIGEVSNPIEVPGRVFIMRLEAKQEAGYYTLEEKQTDIENRIRMDRQQVALTELDAEIAERAQVGNIEQFVQYALEVLYRRFKHS